MSWSNLKILLTISFDYKGIFNHVYAPHGQTVNKAFARCGICEILLAGKGQTSMRPVSGICDMKTHLPFQRILCSIFWSMTMFSHVRQPTYSQIATFSSLQISNPTWRNRISKWMRRFSCKLSQKWTSTNWNNAGKCVWLQKWTTSKEVKSRIVRYRGFLFKARYVI